MKRSLRKRPSPFAAPDRRRRRAGVAALAALLTVAVYTLGNLAGLVHLAFVRHEVCGDHGALVHAGHRHEAAPAPVVAGGPSLATHAAPADGHHHCTVGDHLRRDGLAARPAEWARAAPPLRARAIAPASSAHAPIRPLRLAPKHSPPAAA